MDSAGELFGVVGVFAAFLMRERVPEGRDGFVGFVVGDSPGVGDLLVRASSWSSASNAMSAGSSPAGFGLHDEISVLVDADPVHGGDARVGGGEGDDGYTGGVEDQLRGGGHQCGTVLGYSGIQIGLGSIELVSGPHRPAPGCLVNRYNRVVLYVTK